jgi:hypothetical protein
VNPVEETHHANSDDGTQVAYRVFGRALFDLVNGIEPTSGSRLNTTD